MSVKLTFLGTGTSAGIPLIGCHCDVCSSPDPRNNRTRPSVMVSYAPRGDAGVDGGSFLPIVDGLGGEIAGEKLKGLDAERRLLKRFVIDTGPDFREQMLRHGVDFIDGVFYTHTHADHIYGLDDLRRYNAVLQEPIYIYAEQKAIDCLRETFSYVFDPSKNVNQSFIASLIPVVLEAGLGISLYGARWTPLRLLHGRLPILGYRVDVPNVDGGFVSLAYCTDVSAIPPETYALLEGLDVLILDGLRYRHHPTHMTVDRALYEMERIKPRRGFLTHLAHEIDHEALSDALPEGVMLPYDGLEIEF